MPRASCPPALPPVREGRSIPPVLHQIYFKGAHALPSEIVETVADLRARNPGWTYRLHDAAAAEDYIGQTYGREILDIYLGIDPVYYAARADLFRYLICYAEGGVYLDIKSTAQRPFDEILLPDDRFILCPWVDRRDGRIPSGQHQYVRPELDHLEIEYVQWFIATTAGHPFLARVIQSVLGRLQGYRTFIDGIGREGVFRVTGPVPYTLAIEALRPEATYRWADYETDLGLVYSIYNDHLRHRKVLGDHYSRQTRPIVRRGAVTTMAAKAWFGTLPSGVRRLKRKLGMA